MPAAGNISRASMNAEPTIPNTCLTPLTARTSTSASEGPIVGDRTKRYRERDLLDAQGLWRARSAGTSGTRGHALGTDAGDRVTETHAASDAGAVRGSRLSMPRARRPRLHDRRSPLTLWTRGAAQRRCGHRTAHRAATCGQRDWRKLQLGGAPQGRTDLPGPHRGELAAAPADSAGRIRDAPALLRERQASVGLPRCCGTPASSGTDGARAIHGAHDHRPTGAGF